MLVQVQNRETRSRTATTTEKEKKREGSTAEKGKKREIFLKKVFCLLLVLPLSLDPRIFGNSLLDRILI